MKNKNKKMTLYGLRKDSRCSREDVAKYINVSTSTIENWELGNSEPRVSQAFELADFYDVDVTEIDFKRA